MSQRPTALLLATMDTKWREAEFLREGLERMGVPVRSMDAGIRGASPLTVDIQREAVAAAAGRTLADVQKLTHESEALDIMTAGARRLATDLQRRGAIHGIVSLGGSMGTTLGSAVMRALPIGFPKVMVSTMASRDTRAFVGTRDIMMLHAVCDLSGLNRITRRVLRNGAMALAGMLTPLTVEDETDGPLVLMSTLGTTEACTQRLRGDLEERGFEVVVFHTVGAGGEALERMVAEETVVSVLDLSLHEMLDHRFGGDYDAGPERCTGALRRKVPCLLVPGNIDFLVCGPLEAARKRYPRRALHAHNAAITVVRSSPQEMAAIGARLAELCNAAEGPYAILVPEGGFSAFDHPDGPFPDPEGRRSFTAAVAERLADRSALQQLPFHINDAAFAQALIDRLHAMLGG